jgi:hypothetical protein
MLYTKLYIRGYSECNIRDAAGVNSKKMHVFLASAWLRQEIHV